MKRWAMCRTAAAAAAPSAVPISRSSDSTGDSFGSSAAGTWGTARKLLRRPPGPVSVDAEMRRATIGLVGLVATIAFAAPAQASRLVTLVTHSKDVNPSKVEFNGQPGLRVNVLLPDGY